MEWSRNCVDRLSQTVKSAYSSVGTSNDEEKLASHGTNKWFCKNIIGKIIPTAQSGLTPTKNTFVESARPSPFLRLNSQGETMNFEEDPFGFPLISPQKEMAKEPQPHMKTSPNHRGWFNPSHRGRIHREHFNNQHRSFGGAAQYIPSGAYSPFQQPMFMDNRGIQHSHTPWPSHFNNNLAQFSWLPHIPNCVYSMPINPGAQNDIYHFQGNSHSDYRDPRMAHRNHQHGNQHRSNSNRGRSPRRTWNSKPNTCNNRSKTAPTSKPHSSTLPAGPAPNLQCDHRPIGTVPSPDVIAEKLSNLSISSEKLTPVSRNDSCHEVQSINACEPVSNQDTGIKSEVKTEDVLVKDEKVDNATVELPTSLMQIEDQVSNTSQDDRKKLCQSSERVDDALLAFELCGSPSVCKAVVQAQVVSPMLAKKPSCPTPKDSDIAQVHTSCLTLTPKTTCLNGGSKKKKARPSAKKRRRQKQRAEGRIITVTPHPKKQKTEPSTSSADNDTKPRSDSLSFVIDFSESEISEAETLHSTSPATSSTGISPLKFSLFINAGDLSTETEDSSSEEDSDSDFFDEDTVDCAPRAATNKTCDLLQDFDFGLSPVTFQIRYQVSNNNVPRSESSENEDTDHEMAEQSSVVTEANSRWQEAYDGVPLPKSGTPSKVRFAGGPQLATVHTLRGDEAEAYREARLGKWEEYARDRERFRNRIDDVSRAISYCLDAGHRDRVRARRDGS